ncbi:hypothetical protein [Flagellimonas myxillae]|uniref:hypothetical protein n=1 Tax=Flagellimonas myxillae TaxID=2942214 RepID=UPI00201E90EF|nr:hypothetical protein [Muricauda myxillae]MCL6265002.1 hypothetical protein [Muricauda myxillae]
MPGEAWKKVAMISTSFRKFSSWNGRDDMSELDLNVLKNFIEEARPFTQPIRFWATPDTEKSWELFANLGVDYINTDKPYKVAKHFKIDLPKAED